MLNWCGYIVISTEIQEELSCELWPKDHRTERVIRSEPKVFEDFPWSEQTLNLTLVSGSHHYSYNIHLSLHNILHIYSSFLNITVSGIKKLSQKLYFHKEVLFSRPVALVMT